MIVLYRLLFVLLPGVVDKIQDPLKKRGAPIGNASFGKFVLPYCRSSMPRVLTPAALRSASALALSLVLMAMGAPSPSIERP